MPLENTARRYGAVARLFHWLTALLVLTAIPLGVIANAIPFETEANIAQKELLFSIHKTVGVTVFFVALARILWAVTQPRPAPLHPGRRGETLLADLAHWTLYGGLVLVPLSGWLHHAATTGFAPIWWPFGQSLPFVPIDFWLAELFGSWHDVLTKVLGAAILLHVAGALKHALIDRDGTLARMWRGTEAGPADAPPRRWAPPLMAAALWLAAIGGGTALGLSDREAVAGPHLPDPAAQWMVEAGRVTVTVQQYGDTVEGEITDWIAAVTVDPAAQSPVGGRVEVNLVTATLEIGPIAADVLGPGVLDATAHPVAILRAEIVPAEAQPDRYALDGTLTLRGRALTLDAGAAQMLTPDTALIEARVEIEAADLDLPPSPGHGGEPGFPVVIEFEVTARRLAL